MLNGNIFNKYLYTFAENISHQFKIRHKATYMMSNYFGALYL